MTSYHSGSAPIHRPFPFVHEFPSQVISGEIRAIACPHGVGPLQCASESAARLSTLLSGSHSSAGQSVRRITVRSAVQARVGPSDPKPGQRDGRTVGPLKSKSGPLWLLQRWASCPLWGLKTPLSIGTVVAVSWATDVRVRACGFCSSLALQMFERCRGAKFPSRSHSSAG